MDDLQLPDHGLVVLADWDVFHVDEDLIDWDVIAAPDAQFELHGSDEDFVHFLVDLVEFLLLVVYAV